MKTRTVLVAAVLTGLVLGIARTRGEGAGAAREPLSAVMADR